MYKLSPAAYVFTHQYLNTMQQGIQSAHAIAEISVRAFSGNDTIRDGYVEWATHHKTIRILNAGSGAMFDDTYRGFVETTVEYHLPFALFCEPDISDMMTAFGFIMTPKAIERIEMEAKILEVDMGEDPDSHPVLALLSQLHSAK